MLLNGWKYSLLQVSMILPGLVTSGRMRSPCVSHWIVSYRSSNLQNKNCIHCRVSKRCKICNYFSLIFLCKGCALCLNFLHTKKHIVHFWLKLGLWLQKCHLTIIVLTWKGCGVHFISLIALNLQILAPDSIEKMELQNMKKTHQNSPNITHDYKQNPKEESFALTSFKLPEFM